MCLNVILVQVNSFICMHSNHCSNNLNNSDIICQTQTYYNILLSLSRYGKVNMRMLNPFEKIVGRSLDFFVKFPTRASELSEYTIFLWIIYLFDSMEYTAEIVILSLKALLSLLLHNFGRRRTALMSSQTRPFCYL